MAEACMPRRPRSEVMGDMGEGERGSTRPDEGRGRVCQRGVTVEAESTLHHWRRTLGRNQ
jgi:hypothetical protein